MTVTSADVNWVVAEGTEATAEDGVVDEATAEDGVVDEATAEDGVVDEATADGDGVANEVTA
ncbi:hypothetical protein M0R89_04100 [Halorussus limi]|uniref:Uncharacterized protein n=1 Tax=Halorussus limi TaxID=2938695 RepID=A0A8U0HVW6_9EURY|nr:hypothetical protein [Halorussus limi]UPV75255.1 hypothetical protein M0R89_04100 [Halorussus limi]